jgi:hypothetical protein
MAVPTSASPWVAFRDGLPTRKALPGLYELKLDKRNSHFLQCSTPRSSRVEPGGDIVRHRIVDPLPQRVAGRTPRLRWLGKGATGAAIQAVSIFWVKPKSQIGLTTQPKCKNLPFIPLQIATLKSGAFQPSAVDPLTTRKPFDWTNLAVTPVK